MSAFKYFYYYFPVYGGLCGCSDGNNTHGANRSEAHTILSHHQTGDCCFCVCWPLLVHFATMATAAAAAAAETRRVCINMFNWCARNRTNGLKQSRAHAGREREMHYSLFMKKKKSSSSNETQTTSINSL